MEATRKRMTNESEIRVYEAMFLVDPGDAAAWDDLSKHLTGILTRHGAEVVGITRWDERKLAYPIGKRKRGTYVLSFFCLTDGSVVVEIERDCQLSEKVLRALVLRASHFTVADMRMQLGEDIHEEVAQKLAAVLDKKPADEPQAAVPDEAGEPQAATTDEANVEAD